MIVGVILESRLAKFFFDSGRCGVVKRIVMFAIALTACIQAFAQYSDFSYTTNNGAITITGYTGAGGAVVIPDEINGLPVNTIGYRAFYSYNTLTAVTIPDSVTSIGDYAFYGCSGLTGNLNLPDNLVSIGRSSFNFCRGLTGPLIIPSSVTSISDYAFNGCSGLTDSLTLPDSLISIDDSAFSGCRGLTGNLIIPASVTSIGDSPFKNCIGLTAIHVDTENPAYMSADGVLFNKDQTTLIQCPGGKTGSYAIPDGVTSINDYAFYECSGITGGWILPDSLISIGDWAFYNCNGLTGNLTLPASVTTIGKWTFRSCGGITAVTLPASINSIGDGLFYNCRGLTGSLTIPASVISIGDYAFRYCIGLTAIHVDTGNPAYMSADGVLFNKDQTTLIRYPEGKIGNYSIPSGVTSINDRAFSYCKKLFGNLVIPASVASIGDTAFQSCSGLTAFNVDFANPFYMSADGVLFDKSQTTLLQCPGGKTGSYAIPDGVTSINDYAFYECSGLTGPLIIPDSVNSIGDSAFMRCSQLTGNLIIPNGVTSIGSSTFYECSGLSSVTIPDGVTSIGSSAFNNCSGLTGNLIIPDSVTSIGSWAFRTCSGLTAIHVDTENPAYMSADGVLFNKDQTTLIQCPGGKTGSYAIPDGVESIENAAFYFCSGLTDLTIPDSVTNIDSAAFDGCSGLTGSFSIPDSVTSIATYAFRRCLGLAALDVDPANPSYTSTDGILFNKDQTTLLQCPGGKTGSYAVPSNVIFIASHAFFDCRELTGNLSIPVSVTLIGHSAFRNCNGVVSINVDSENTVYSSLDGVLFNKDQTSLIQCPGGKPGSYTVPSSVVSIDSRAFAGYSNLAAIDVDSQNQFFTSADGILFSKDQTTLLQCPGGKTGDYTIPDEVTSIGDYAFRECVGLTALTIPHGVTSIGTAAFWNCSGLNGIYFYGNPPRYSSTQNIGKNIIIYRLPAAKGWPPVPYVWGERPTALWWPESNSDTDNDELPDWWENQYFGGITSAETNEICSNGLNTAYQAYIAGLDPNDPQSIFKIYTPSDNGKEIAWSPVPGRVYSAYWTTNLLSGFQCVESNIPWTRPSFTNQTIESSGFYKICVQLIP